MKLSKFGLNVQFYGTFFWAFRKSLIMKMDYYNLRYSTVFQKLKSKNSNNEATMKQTPINEYLPPYTKALVYS